MKTLISVEAYGNESITMLAAKAIKKYNEKQIMDNKQHKDWQDELSIEFSHLTYEHVSGKTFILVSHFYISKKTP